jgi:hypothetical protein
MSWDLDKVLSVAFARGDAPRLFELGRAIGRGAPTTTTYAWSSGRICATRGSGWVRIKRRMGVVGPGITLHDDELCALAGVARRWAAVRQKWAAFYYSGAGYPPGFGSGCYYQAPGARGKRVTIGVSGLGRRGRGLEGRDEIRRPARVARSRKGAELLGEIWRRGERFGPRAGSLVGERYAIGADLRVEVRRHELCVSRRRTEDEVVIEPDETELVAALLELIDGGSEQDRPSSH